MKRTVLLIKDMDCASEENLVRMKLNELPGIRSMDFDIPNRKLSVIHSGNASDIAASVASLNLNSSVLSTDTVTETELEKVSDGDQSTVLWQLLIINFSFFLIEIVTGFFSQSMGLVADSLDMLADAFVYGLSLYAVGHAIEKKKRVATISGYFQIVLAVIGLIEVTRRFFGHELYPDFRIMIVISILALIANSTGLYLLQKSKSKEVHMQASLIFTSNDVVINVGVILAGALVYFTHSKYPDLIIGFIVFVIVTRGAVSILKLGR